VRREAVKALEASHSSEESAAASISRSLRDFYQAHPVNAPGADVERAVLAMQNIYRRSVFPDMKVTFGTYPDNVGHVDAPGCFRCHDDDHVAKDGRKIGQDCETCHEIE
jgi:cytochrome c556